MSHTCTYMARASISDLYIGNKLMCERYGDPVSRLLDIESCDVSV